MRRRKHVRTGNASADVSNWEPKTEIGRKVKAGEITNIDEVLLSGKPILEPEIVDYLIPDLKYEILEIRTTQRVTDCGRKQKFRATVLVGDGHGHVGLGTGKSEELRPAIEAAIRNAKKNIILVRMGCGSWECNCGGTHSLPMKVMGKCGSTYVVLQPGPKGLGLAANHVIKSVLTLAGVKDVWSRSFGHTTNVLNLAKACINALNSLNEIKPQPKR